MAYSRSNAPQTISLFTTTPRAYMNHVWEISMCWEGKGISLNILKFVSARQKTKFLGYVLFQYRYQTGPQITAAISDYLQPDNITDLHSFLGPTNQLSEFTDVISTLTESLRPLLKSKHEFVWDIVHEQAFDKTKQDLTSSPILVYYDPQKLMSLHVDAGRLRGLGFVLKQQREDGECYKQDRGAYQTLWPVMQWSSLRCWELFGSLKKSNILSGSSAFRNGHRSHTIVDCHKQVSSERNWKPSTSTFEDEVDVLQPCSDLEAG